MVTQREDNGHAEGGDPDTKISRFSARAHDELEAMSDPLKEDQVKCILAIPPESYHDTQCPVSGVNGIKTSHLDLKIKIFIVFRLSRMTPSSHRRNWSHQVIT